MIPPVRQSREPLAWAVAALLLLAAYLYTAPRAWQCEGVDEIEYLALADSLDRGQGYTIYGQPYVYYPPLYAVLVARFLDHPAPLPWPLLYGFNAALGWLALVGFAWYLRRREPEAGVPASWLMLLSYYPWSFSTRYLMAEQVHFLAVAGGLIAADRVLAGGRGRLGWVALLAGCALAAATAKASAVALLGALALAGAMHLFRRRAWQPVAGLALAVALAGLFVVGWEVRAAWLDPGAKESYGRWVLKWLGLSAETSGVVAANYGEGVAGPTSWFDRVGFVVERLGQFVLSVPRPPPNFLAAAALVAALVGRGAWRTLRRRADDPAAWYLVLTLLMMSATSWVSSYLRYLYPVAPLLFLYAVRGAQGLGGLPAAVPKVAGGLVLAWTAFRGWSGGPGAEGLFRGMIGLAIAGAGALLVLGPCVLRPRWTPRWSTGLLILLVAGLGLQAAALAAQRHRICRSGAPVAERGLDHVQAAADWVRGQAPAEARIVASLPRLGAYLSGRVVADWDPAAATGEMPDLVWLLGELPGNPAARPERETALRGWVRAHGWTPRFQSGAAGLYGPPASP